MPSYGYSFFVDNESGYEFTATLTFESIWYDVAPGYNIEVLDPDGKILHKEFLECLDYKEDNVFHGPSAPDATDSGPLKSPDWEPIYPTTTEPATISFDIPASETGGIYQIRIVHPYVTLNSEGSLPTVALELVPPLPYGWKGDMGFSDLCMNDDASRKSGSVYFCSLPPGIMNDNDPNAGVKQWFQSRGFDQTDGAAGFDIKIWKDVVDGDDVLLKQITIEKELDENNNIRRSWPVHDTSSVPSLPLEYSISGPEHLKNDPDLPREVYRIDWVNRDDVPSGGINAHTLLLETHEATEDAAPDGTTPSQPDEVTSDFIPPKTYSRQGATDVPLILCSDRNTAIRLNNGISYEYDEDLEVYPWDSKRITFLNANQKAAWQKLKQARQNYKSNVFNQNLVNTQEDPYWVGRPGDSEGGDWDYAGEMQESIRTNILADRDANVGNLENSKYWGEDKLNRLSNAVVKSGLFEFLPCHIFEQNMDPNSPWFGVFWDWHKNVHEEIKNGGSDPFELGNPYSSVFRYLHTSNGSVYSNWEDKVFPRLGPDTSNLARPLARMYSLGDTREDLGLGFLRDANPFYKNVGIRNRLVLALLHQLMSFDQNGDSTLWNSDYRGGAIAFTTNTIVPLLDVWADIGTTEDDIFQDDDAVEVKEILKTGIMNHLERYAGYLICSSHNQWVHAWIALSKAAACFNDSAIDYLFLRNIKVSDNRYNHNVPTWQESGGYDNSYCAFAIYSLAQVRGFLLKRRDTIIENGEGDDILAINELTLRDFESQVNDLTDYWNHTIVLEPDGSVNGCHDFNSRVDGAHWGSSPRRFLEFIGPPYGTTINIPEMTACHSLVAWTTGRNYETWNDMYRQWQHNVADPYGVSFDFDVDNGDGVSIAEKRANIQTNMTPSNDSPYSPTRFREDFTNGEDGLVGLDGTGINPSVTISTPREVKFKWTDKDKDTLSLTQGPIYANFGISPTTLRSDPPPPLPAHSVDEFVKLWPSFVLYNKNSIRTHTNQKNVNPDSSVRPDVGGISVKTDKYYCHIHADGWNTINQDQDWTSRRTGQHDPEYMWALTSSAGGGFSLFTTPENGSVLCGRRKGWLGSNQIYMKRYKNEEVNHPLDDPDSVWNQKIDEDGCGYAWAEPSSDNATVEWTEDIDLIDNATGAIGSFVHRQHFNRNFLAKPTDLDYVIDSLKTFDNIAEDGGIGYIERTYVFTDDAVKCRVIINPKRTINWDDIYMTLPISVIGRGYLSGDSQYVQNEQARKNKNRYNGEGNIPSPNTSYGDRFETEKDGCWKKEVFIGNDKVTIGHRHFNPNGTEISFSSGVVDNIDRLVSGPGTDPLYPQTVDSPDTSNCFWPPSPETLTLQPQLGKFGSAEDLLVYCNSGQDQTDLPRDWCVPAPSGYSSKTSAGKTTDDALRVHFNDSVKNWTSGSPIEFTFTMTPGKDLTQAEDESSTAERSITITDYPDLEKVAGGMMNGWGTEDGSNPTMDHSHVFITEDLFTTPNEFTRPTFNGQRFRGRVFGDPAGQFIQGSGTIHIFGDLRLDPAGTPPETGSSAYVRREPGPGIAGCSVIPGNGDFGWHMALTMLTSNNGNIGFPDNCDRGIHTVTSFPEQQIHLEIPFDNPNGDRNDFFLHMHEDINAFLVNGAPGSGFLSNIIITIDFDD